MSTDSKTFFDTPYHEDRPWGSFDQFDQNTSSTVKIIRVKPGECTSLQDHHKRQEFWYIVSGDGQLIIGEDTCVAVVGEHFVVPLGVQHRIQAGTTELVLLEISTGNFDEKDIERLEDKYNRT